MAKDIRIKVGITDNIIPVKVSIGQTVERVVGPDTYTGPVTVTPSESEQTLQTADKMLTDNVTVNPIPSEYIIPTGAEVINVTENGTVSRDVTNKATVTINVDVPTPVPTGTIEITENGTYDVAQMAQAIVSVSAPQNVVTGSFVGNGRTDVTVPAPFAPDIVIVFSPDKLADYAVNAVWYLFISPIVAFQARRTTSGWSASANVNDMPASNNMPGKTWLDGQLQIYSSNSSVYQFANGATYNYILVKLP